MTTMRAAVLSAAQQFDLQEIDVPDVQPGGVLVRIHNCGICGSDLHFYRGEFPAPPALRMGHEPAGEVAAVGPGVTTLREGQRVCIEPVEVCERCLYCRTGREQLCPDRKFLGTMLPGAFATYVHIPAYAVHPLPDNVDFEVGALIEPLAVSVHGLRQVGFAFGERVCVLGAGTIGLTAIVAARAMGASEVFATARYPHQAELARDLGADLVAAADETAVPTLSQAFGTRPPEVVVETVGGEADTVGQAITLVQAGGRVSIVGIFSKPVTVNATVAALKEVSLVGAITYGTPNGLSDFDVAIGIAASHVEDLRKLITHRVPLDDIAQGFATANDKSQRSVKVTVEV